MVTETLQRCPLEDGLCLNLCRLATGKCVTRRKEQRSGIAKEGMGRSAPTIICTSIVQRSVGAL